MGCGTVQLYSCSKRCIGRNLVYCFYVKHRLYVALYMAAVSVHLSILFAIAFANVIVQGDGPENATQPEIAIVTAPHHVIVEKKSPLLLNCSVVTSKTFGPLEFTWQKDGQSLIPQVGDRRIQIFQNGSLYFRRIIHRKRRENRLSDEGLYECVAGNNNGSVVARRVHVEVACIVRNFTHEPSPMVTHVGGSARFDCSIKATPPATIVWQRDNVQLTGDDHRFVQLPSGALQIHDVTKDDEGSYRCMAAQNFNHLPDEVTNIKWKWSQQARLHVVDNQGSGMDVQLLAAPQNTTAMAGETVILECLANGIPAPSIEWRRRDHKALSDRHQAFGGGNLMIMNVQSEDAGVYQCVLSRDLYKQQHEAVLNVHTYPVMINDPESNEWPMTRTVSLVCDVEGNPKPTIMWYFNGIPIHKLKKETIRYELTDENTRLIVFTIRLENAGYYQCIAENTIGQVFAIARVEVFAHKDAPPPPQKVTLTPVNSSTMILEWTQEQTGKPILAFLITYRLREEGSLNEVQSTVEGTRRSYNLTDLRPYTTYVVTIRTFSRKGSSIHYSVEGRTLEGVPLAVPTFQVSSPSAETMLVTWDELPEKDKGGIITHYQLQYRPAATPSAITTLTIRNPQDHSYLVKGLKSETKYEMRLVAGTKNGFPKDWGGWSHHVTPKANSNGRSTPQLKVDVLNTSAVLLHWERLEVKEDDNQAYYIQAVELWQLGKDSVLFSAVLDPPAHTYILTELENNTDYEVTVYGSQKQIQVTHTFRISEGLLEPTASKLRSQVMNPSTVRLEWTLSGKDWDIVKYQVCYKESTSSTDLVAECVDSERTYAVISKLKPFTKYQFGIRIITDQRHSSFTTLEVETTEDKPGPPVNLTYEVLKRGSVQLQWSPPSEPNGVITSYIIFYNLDSDVPDSLWTNLTKTGQQRIAQVDGLDVQQYFFKMSACTKAGRGHPSKIVMVYPDCISNPQCSTPEIDEDQKGLTDKQVGIIIGVSIGVACIIICIIVILCRHRCFQVSSNSSPAATNHSLHHHHGNNNVPIYHGNGHMPSGHGNGHAHAPLATDQNLGSVEMTALETMPMLMRLPENEMSDAKGGGDMIVTPNGVRMNGLVKINGHLPNSHVPPANLDLSATSEECRGLIEAMLAATNGNPLQHSSSSDATLAGNNSSGGGDSNDLPGDPEGDSLSGIDHYSAETRQDGRTVPPLSDELDGPTMMLAGNVGSSGNATGLVDRRLAPFPSSQGNKSGGGGEEGEGSPYRDKAGDSRGVGGYSGQQGGSPMSSRHNKGGGDKDAGGADPRELHKPFRPFHPQPPQPGDGSGGGNSGSAGSPPSSSSSTSTSSSSSSTSSQHLRKTATSSPRQPATSPLRSAGHRYLATSPLPPPPPPPPPPSPPPSPPPQDTSRAVVGAVPDGGECEAGSGSPEGSGELCREGGVSFAPRPSLPQSSSPSSSSSSHQAAAAASSMTPAAAAATAAAKSGEEEEQREGGATTTTTTTSPSSSSASLPSHSHPVC